MSRRRKIVLGLLVALLLVPTAALYWAVSTESGLRFVAGQFNRRIGPVTLTIEQPSGTLLRGFKVGHLRLQHRRSDIVLDGLSGHLEFAPLLVQRIHLRDLAIDTAHVTVLRDPNPTKKPWQPKFLPRMLRLDVSSLTIANGSLTAINGQRFVARRVVASATVLPRQIRVNEFALNLPELLVDVAGTARVNGAIPLGVTGEFDGVYRPADLPIWHFKAALDGDLETLPMQVDLDLPFRAKATGNLKTLTTRWNYDGEARFEDLDLTRFGAGDALGPMTGTLQVQVDATGYRAQGTVTPPGLAAGPMAVTFDGQYRARRIEVRKATATHAPSGSQLTTSGAILLDKAGPNLQLEGDWSTFRWPLTGRDIAFTSPRGHYTLQGSKPWNVTAQGDITPTDWPTMPATLTGVLDGDRLQIATAQLGLMGGQARFSGQAQWKPAESWQLEGTVADLDPAQLRADLPGRLSFDFRAQGAPFGDGAALDLTAEKLRGRLRGAAASGRGQFAKAAGSEDWLFKGVDLRFGRTRVQLDGGLGARRDLTFAIDADDLSLLDRAARGRVSARGRYAGTADAPLLLFKARGTQFEWGGNTLAALDADVDIDLSTQGRTLGQVRLDGLNYGGRRIERATLALSGQASTQRLVAELEASPVRLGLTADGVFAAGTWRGVVNALRLTDSVSTRKLDLSLDAPAPLEFTTDTLQLGNLCLAGKDERLCFSAQRDPEAWHTRFSAERLPLRTLTAGLSQDIDYEGTINVTGNAHGGKQKPLTGELRADLANAELRHRIGNGREERMALGSGKVEATATPEGFVATVGLDAGASGSVRGSLNGQRVNGPWKDMPIQGRLDLTTDGLGLLDIYLGGIDRATGRLQTGVAISGTLGQPAVEGELQLRDARIDVYQVNLSLRELSLDAKFNANELSLDGNSRIGEGLAKFSGTLAWRGREPFGTLRVEGEHLRVVDVPEARIEASPKLEFKLTGHNIDATGSVDLPYPPAPPIEQDPAGHAGPRIHRRVLHHAAHRHPREVAVARQRVERELGIDAITRRAREHHVPRPSLPLAHRQHRQRRRHAIHQRRQRRDGRRRLHRRIIQHHQLAIGRQLHAQRAPLERHATRDARAAAFLPATRRAHRHALDLRRDHRAQRVDAIHA